MVARINRPDGQADGDPAIEFRHNGMRIHLRCLKLSFFVPGPYDMESGRCLDVLMGIYTPNGTNATGKRAKFFAGSGLPMAKIGLWHEGPSNRENRRVIRYNQGIP